MLSEEKNHALVVAQQFKTLELANAALGRSGLVSDSVSGPGAIPTEVRSVRRGKFFLSRTTQLQHGSIRRPIFQHWGHGVVVGEMSPSMNDGVEDGSWCYGAHNDFDLVPEFMKPTDWPEYVRTETGWVRKDGDRRLSAPSEALERLLDWSHEQLRLK